MDSVWKNLTKALATYNFSVDCRSNPLKFNGFVETNSFGRVNLSLIFENKACTEFPKVKFYDLKMSKLFRKVPHINRPDKDDNDLCYIQQGTLTFDAQKPNDMVRFIREQIVKTLDTPKERFAEEFTKELFSYWEDNTEKDEKITINIRPCNFVHVTISKFSKEEEQIAGHLYTISSNIDLSKINFPFIKMEDIFTFAQMGLGKRKFRKLKQRVLNKCFTKEQFVLVFKTDKHLMGVIVSPTDTNRLVFHFFIKDRTKRLFSRNIHSSAMLLHNKKILVVGCGTLGSNLIPMLVKCKAGFSQALTLVDADFYKEVNFSRHNLGLDALYKNKAEVMKTFLLNTNSSIQEVIGHELKIDTITEKFENAFGEGKELNFDIIIDTTGNESLSHYIDRKIRESSQKPIFICGYIYGQSRAVCASVQKDSKQDSLYSIDQYIKIQGILPELDENEAVTDSCNSVYIPFPITASIQAANLIMTALYKAVKKGCGYESVFWYQKCDDNVWGDMKQIVIS